MHVAWPILVDYSLKHWYPKRMSRALRTDSWLISNVLSARGITLLYGQPRLLVTGLAMEWGILLSAGLEWLSFPTKQSSVAYLHTTVNIHKHYIPALLQRHCIAMPDTYKHIRTYLNPLSIQTYHRIYFNKVKRIRPDIMIIDAHTCVQYSVDAHPEKLAKMLLAFCRDVYYTLEIPVLIVHPATDRMINDPAMLFIKDTVDNILHFNATEHVSTLTCEKHIDNITVDTIPFKTQPISKPFLCK